MSTTSDRPIDDVSSDDPIAESIFSGAELRVGGINRRGLLQPLLPVPEAPDPLPQQVAASSPWLEPLDGDRVEVTGELAAVLSMTAAARAAVVVQAGDQVSFLFGCLGQTDRGAELRRIGGSDRWRARRGLGSDLAWEAVKRLPGTALSEEGVPPQPPAALLDGSAPSTATLDAAYITAPDQPVLQQRLSVHEVDGISWLVIAARQGEGSALSLAVRSAGRLERAVVAMLLGLPVVL